MFIKSTQTCHIETSLFLVRNNYGGLLMNLIKDSKNLRTMNLKLVAKLLMITFLLSITTSFFLEYFQMMKNPIDTLEWISGNTKNFFLSTLLVFFIYLFSLSLIGNIYISSIICLIIFAALGYSNESKLSLLGEPLYPVDFYQIKHVKCLFNMIGGSISTFTILIIIAIIFFIVYRIKKSSKIYLSMFQRAVLLVLSCFVIYSYVHFDKTFINELTMRAGVDVILWNQPENYNSNGFIFGLLSNLQNNVIEEPEGYSEEVIRQISEKYIQEANKLNNERASTEAVSPNIVFIMSETFWDPTRLSNINFSADPMPNIRDIMSSYSSGWLLSPAYGGGTANVEFEALTGLSMYNLVPGSVPYQQNLDKKSSFPSIVSLLEEKGYDTLAIHPYNKVFYKRDKVYNALGFNSFIGQAEMKHTEMLSKNSYISDQAVVEEVMNKLKENSKSLFIHTVTMQNHLPISEGKYGTNSIAINGLSEEPTKELETYSEGIKQTDLAVKSLVDNLAEFNEPTIVVFWGDHLPALNTSIYEEAGYYNSDSYINERNLSETPLFIYANFDLEKKSLKTLSPAFLGVTLFDMLGQPISPYYAMLKDLQSHLPGLKNTVTVDSEGNIKNELTDEENLLIKNYKLIQYDLMNGKDYSLPMIFNNN
jgi:phosphoglycerol transferase MdoB-like AlkP superfamily enzyme